MRAGLGWFGVMWSVMMGNVSTSACGQLSFHVTRMGSFVPQLLEALGFGIGASLGWARENCCSIMCSMTTCTGPMSPPRVCLDCGQLAYHVTCLGVLVSQLLDSWCCSSGTLGLSVAIWVVARSLAGRIAWARGIMDATVQCPSTQIDVDSTQVEGMRVKRHRLTYGQACAVTGQDHAHLNLPDMTTIKRRRFEQNVTDKAEDLLMKEEGPL